MASNHIARPQSIEPYSLVICGDCYGVRGRFPERGADAEQLCSCAPVETRRNRRPSGGADHCTYVELCRCCGLVLLSSGSRWSVWFCEQCLPLIAGLNRAVGWMTAPIGRHSVMNGVGLAASSTASHAAVEQFTAASIGLFERIGALEQYARAVVEQNVELLDLPVDTDVYVGEYLAAVRRSQLRCDDAFFALLFNFALTRKEAA